MKNKVEWNNLDYDSRRFWSDFVSMLIISLIFVFIINWIFYDRPITFWWRIIIAVTFIKTSGILRLFKKSYWK